VFVGADRAAGAHEHSEEDQTANRPATCYRPTVTYGSTNLLGS